MQQQWQILITGKEGVNAPLPHSLKVRPLLLRPWLLKKPRACLSFVQKVDDVSESGRRSFEK